MESTGSIHEVPGDIIKEFIINMDRKTFIAFINTCKVYYNMLSRREKTQKHKDFQIVELQKYTIMFDKVLYYGVEYTAFKYLKITADKKAVTELTYKDVYCYDCSTPISITNIEKHKTSCTKKKSLICEICGSPTSYHKTYISQCIFSTFNCKDCKMELYQYETLSHIGQCKNFNYAPSVYKKPNEYKRKKKTSK